MMRSLPSNRISLLLLRISILSISLLLLFCLFHSIGLFVRPLSFSNLSLESYVYVFSRRDIFGTSVLIIIFRSILVSLFSVCGAIIMSEFFIRQLRASTYFVIALFMLIPFIVGEYVRAFSWLQLASQGLDWSILNTFVSFISINPLVPVVASQVSAFLPLTLVALLLALPAANSRVWMVLNETCSTFVSRLYFVSTQARSAILSSLFFVFTLSFFSTVEPQYLGASSHPLSNIGFSQIMSTLLNIDPTARYSMAFCLIVFLYIFLNAIFLAYLLVVGRYGKSPRLWIKPITFLLAPSIKLYPLSRSFIARLNILSDILQPLYFWISRNSEILWNLFSFVFLCTYFFLSFLPLVYLILSIIHAIPSLFSSIAPQDYLDPILASLEIAFPSSVLALVAGSLLSLIFLGPGFLRSVAFLVILTGALFPGFLFALVLSNLNKSLGFPLNNYFITVLANFSYLVPFAAISISLALLSTSKGLILSSLELVATPLTSMARLVFPMHGITFVFTFLLSVVVAFSEGVRSSMLSGEMVTVSNKLDAGLRSGMTDQSICLALVFIFVIMGVSFALILSPRGPVAMLKD